MLENVIATLPNQIKTEYLTIINDHLDTLNKLKATLDDHNSLQADHIILLGKYNALQLNYIELLTKYKNLLGECIT